MPEVGPDAAPRVTAYIGLGANLGDPRGQLEGAIVALYVAILAERWAPWCDATLARAPGRFR